MRHTVAQPVYFTWQYVIRYHDQCISAPITFSRFVQIDIFVFWFFKRKNLNVVFQNLYPRYHDQCLSSDNVSYGTTTSASHLAMCHTVPWLVQHDNATVVVRMTHCQLKGTGCGTAWHIARLHWSWYRIAHWYVNLDMVVIFVIDRHKIEQNRCKRPHKEQQCHV
jgi:hypothetical protein